jgi:hypothetical protein
MLEKREQTIAMIMVALGDRERASNRLAPAIIVQKTGIAPNLTKLPSGLTLEGDDGYAIGDPPLLSILDLKATHRL